MEIIPRSLVENVWIETGQKTLNELIRLKENFQNNQPQLFQFLIKFTDHISPEAKDLTFYYSQIIWNIFQKAFKQTLPEISQEELMACIEEREQWLEKINDFNFEKIDQLISNNDSINQENILVYALEAILEEGEDNLELNSEDQAYLFWLLLIVVDTLNKVTL